MERKSRAWWFKLESGSSGFVLPEEAKTEAEMRQEVEMKYCYTQKVDKMVMVGVSDIEFTRHLRGSNDE